MPRSNTTGGKYHKKGKKHKGIIENTDNRLEYAGQNQVYASVKKKAGGSRLILDCSDGKERSGIIPGKFKKKIWMAAGDILLCELNTGGDDYQCYITHKYSPKDAGILKAQGKIDFEIVNNTSETSNYNFTETNLETKQNKSNNNPKSESSGSNNNESDSTDSLPQNPNRATNMNDKYRKIQISESSSGSVDLDDL